MHQTFTKKKKRKILMNKTITTALMIALSATTGCIAYAHPPRHPPTHNNHTVRHSPANQVRVAVEVRAWVWINGHYSNNGMWTHGHWEVRLVSRNLLSSHPGTHIRWIEGRSRPARPHRRHRRNRR